MTKFAVRLWLTNEMRSREKRQKNEKKIKTISFLNKEISATGIENRK